MKKKVFLECNGELNIVRTRFVDNIMVCTLFVKMPLARYNFFSFV